MKKRFISSSYQSRKLEKLEYWCKDLSDKIKILYLHHADGRIIGKFKVEDGLRTYGKATVTSSYYEGDGVMSVWLIE